MPAGTITLTNNSTAVTGSGTAFPTELKANDFLVSVVGGTTYTLGVKSVESATALTLTTAYGGPTTGGLAWTPIPNGTLVGITAQIAADTARAIRGLNYDKQNWQQVYSASGNITVTLPDGSTWTGPSWKYLSDNMATKVGGAVPVVQGGTGSDKPFGDKAASFCEGNDQRLSTLDGKSGGAVKSRIVFQAASIDSKGITTTDSAPASYSDMYSNYESAPMALSQSGISVNSFYPEYADKHYHSGKYAGVFYRGIIHTDAPVVHWGYTGENGTVSAQMLQYRPMTGALYVSGSVTSPVISQTSDEDFKDKIETIAGALQKVESIRGVTFNWKDTGMPSAGVIAQELMAVLPESITTHHVGEQRAYGVEYAGVIGLCVEAIKELSEVVNAQNARIERLAKDSSSL